MGHGRRFQAVPERVSREQLVERLANVSHATWIVHGVRDGRTFENPYGPGPIGYADSPEGRDAAEDSLAYPA
jgi:hypothetical protein